MSDEDPFSYTPLRVSKRRKKRPEGCQKRKMGKHEEVDVKEEVKEGIVDLFAGSKRRQSLPLVDEALSGDVLILLSWHLI